MGRLPVFHRTHRLFLRPAFPEDACAVFALMNDRATVRNLASAPWPYRPEDAADWIARGQDRGLPRFLATLPGTGVIGTVGLGRDGETDEINLGYCIAQDHRGRGYASEAARGTLEVARMLGHRRITASHFIDNPASGRVLASVGFRATGEVRPGYSRGRGGYAPVACYAIDLAPGDADQPDDPAIMRRAA